VGRLHPGLPVLYTSGYSEDIIERRAGMEQGVQMLSKPYDRQALAQAIDAALGPSGATAVSIH
jgi:CheY-like chemotaxis protein